LEYKYFRKYLSLTSQIKPVLTGATLPDLSDVTPTGDTVDIDAWYNTAIYVLIIQIAAAYLCYIFGKKNQLSTSTTKRDTITS
jgi:chitin synthase